MCANNVAGALKLVRPVDGFEDIIQSVPLADFKTVLDVGLGAGAASDYFAGAGKTVTAIGLNIAQYKLIDGLRSRIELLECDIFSPLLDGRKFDAVWFSHCLEHIDNPDLALDKVNSLLTDNGWLFICVPTYSPLVQGGHLITGWNIGQLMYMLMLHGFNVRDGHFVHHGYNIAGFVSKTARPLPPLNYDRGDIETLAPYFPKQITAVNAFDGNLTEINWPGFKNPELNALFLRQKNTQACATPQSFAVKAVRAALRGLRSLLRPLLAKLREYSD